MTWIQHFHAHGVCDTGQRIGIAVLLVYRVLLGAPLEQKNVAVPRHIGGITQLRGRRIDVAGAEVLKRGR